MTDHLLSQGRLVPGDAAAAIIVLDDGTYLLQLRDQIPEIFFPGHWGLFGGAIDGDESPQRALRRELREELGIVFDAVSYFTEFTFDFPSHGRVLRRFYEVPISSRLLQDIVLGEGAGVGTFSARTILTELKVVPYDAFAIWLHARAKA